MSQSISKTIGPDGKPILSYSAITSTGDDATAYTEVITDADGTSKAYAYDPVDANKVSATTITTDSNGNMVVKKGETEPGAGYYTSGGESGAASYSTETGSGATSYASGTALLNNQGASQSTSTSTSQTVDGVSTSNSKSTSKGTASSSSTTFQT